MPRWIKLAEVDQVAEGTGLEVEHEGRIFAIFRLAGEFRAIDGMCAHQCGPLADGPVEGSTVTCPWHGWRFDVRDGRCLTGRAPAQRVFDVRIDGRDVLVDVP